MPRFPTVKVDQFLWHPISAYQDTKIPGVYWIYWSSRKLLKVGMSTVDISLRIAKHFEEHGPTEHVFISGSKHDFVIRSKEQSLIKQIEDYNISTSIVEWAIIDELETAKRLMEGKLKQPYSELCNPDDESELFELIDLYVKDYSEYCNGRPDIDTEGKSRHNMQQAFEVIRKSTDERTWKVLVHEWNWQLRQLELTQREYSKAVHEEISNFLKLDATEKRVKRLEEEIDELKEQLYESRSECDELRNVIGSEKFADIDYLRQRVQDLEEDVRHFRDT